MVIWLLYCSSQYWWFATIYKKDNKWIKAVGERRHIYVRDLSPWNVTIKKAYVIRGRFVPAMMPMCVIVYEIWPFVHFFLLLTFPCDLQHLTRSLALWLLEYRCTLCCCILVPSTKFVMFHTNLDIDICLEKKITSEKALMTSSSIRFLWNSNANLPRA